MTILLWMNLNRQSKEEYFPIDKFEYAYYFTILFTEIVVTMEYV